MPAREPFDDHGRRLVATGARNTGSAALAGTFARFLESVPDAMVCVDSSGVVVAANERAHELFGYPAGSLVGRAVEQLVDDRVADLHAAHRERYLADPRSRPMGLGAELLARRADGSVISVEIALSACDVDGVPWGVAAVREVADRSELRVAREHLRAAAARERLQGALNQARRLESLGQMASGIAHDVNNLLTALANSRHLVEARLLASGDHALDDALEELAQMQQVIDQGARMTRQLLAFASRQVAAPEIVDLDTTIEALLPLVRRTLGPRVTVEHRSRNGTTHVLLDPGELEQIIMNVVVNARDAMPGGGRFAMTTWVEADIRDEGPRGRWAVLELTDTGAGMDDTVRERAFEPFFSTKRDASGSGLGLATVYGIAKGAGGRVELRSAPGEGTSVVVRLPEAD